MEFEHQEEQEASASAAAAAPPPHELGLRPPSYDSETAQPNPSSRTLNNMNNNNNNNKEEEEEEDDDSPSPIATVPSPTPATIVGNKKARARYRECLKNHAVGIGGQAVDGCGEFMPAGPEGSLDGLKCAACNCHRNFHRKELEVPRNQTTQQQAVVYQYPVLVPHNQHQHYNHPSTGSVPPHQNQNPHLYQFYPHSHSNRPPGSGGYHHHHLDVGGGGRPLALPCVSGGTGAQSRGGEDEEEDVSNQDTPGGCTGAGIGGITGGGGGGGYTTTTVGSSSKKRFRTKFSQEQKDKMLELAEQLGWKIQKQDEGLIHSFCNETGVKRQVLKVWMHNNKHTLGKKKALN